MNALEQAAIERRERLKRYRDQVSKINKNEEAANAPAEEDEIVGFEEEITGPTLKLRNYTPHDQKFTDAKMKNKRPDKIEGQIKEQLIDNPDELENDDIGLETLQPRKVDWDLKRDLKPKLGKLDRRTHRALTQMLRDRLQPEKPTDTTDNTSENTAENENFE